MKILFISTTFPTPARPRQGAFNRVLVDALAAQHDVRVIAPIPWTQGFQQRAGSGLGERRIVHPIYWYPPKLFRSFTGYFYWKSIQVALARLTADFTPDVVIGYWLHPDGEAAVRASRVFGVPAIVMSGGSDLQVLTRNAARRSRILQVINDADRLIVVSRELAAVANRLGIDSNKVDVVYRGIDRSIFRPVNRERTRQQCNLDSDSIVVLWVGRLEPVKNPTLLLQAAERLYEIWGSRLRVVIIGDGSLIKSMRKLSRRLHLTDVVQFHKSMTQSELAWYYGAANVTVLTSHSEGIPNVLLESIACETPFVATAVGGIAEVASPEKDYLVAPHDVQQFVNAVIDCVQNVRSRVQRRFVPMSVAEMASTFSNVCSRAVNGKGLCGHPAAQSGRPVVIDSTVGSRDPVENHR